MLYLPDPGPWPAALPTTPVTPRDTLNASAAGGVVDTQASVAAENAPLRVIYGEVRLGPLICTVLPYSQGNVILAVWGHGEVDDIVSMSIDDVEIDLGSITTLPTLGKDGTYTGGGTTPINGNVRNYTGKAAQTADTLLIAAFLGQGHTYADNLPGICYSVIYVPTGTSTGFPRINATIRGLKVWTGAATEWSDNPAWCLADFITNTTYGAGRTVDWASVAAVAADCNALVGGEPRRTLNLALETVQPVKSWLDTLRTYAGCWITQDGANLKLIGDKAGSVVASITHAAGQIQRIANVKKRGVQSVPTVLTLTYTDTTALPHKPGTVTIYAAGVLAGTTPRRESTVSLPGINRYSQATREAIERLNKLALNDLSMSLSVFDEALALEVGDIVTVTHPMGFTAKQLRVQSITGELGRFELGLLEYDPAVYDDTVATAPTWADTDLPDPVAEFADTALALVPFEPGPQGPPGEAGADGSDGADGAAGVRGTRQLYLSNGAYVSGYAGYNADATSAVAAATAGSTPTTPIRGDTVTFTNGTNYTYTITYNGSAWEPPGLVVDGSLLVTGSVTASKIDSRGLSIKDASGNIILAAGSPLSVASISGLGSLATQSTVAAGSVTGLGALATQSTVGVGSVTGLGALATQSTVGVGSVTGLGSFATLSQITSANVSTYIAAAAIGEAYIGTITAGKIDTRGLSIKDASGNIILAAGTPLAAANVTPSSGWLNANIAVDGSGNLTGIGTGSGTSVANNQDSVIMSPGGGVLTTQNLSVSGYLKIRLPQSWTSTMLRFVVEVYEYQVGYMCTLEIGGYNYSVGYWVNVSARVVGGSNTEYPVYFGHDGTMCCVWIGSGPGENWVYPQVRVRDVFLGFSSFAKALWESGWQISFDTTAIAPGTGANQYSASVLDTLPGADWRKVAGTGRPADNATLGATFGVNIGGQITAGNASTYIANAAIQSAHIGSLTADVITAGTLNVDRINAGAISTPKMANESITVVRTRSWTHASYEQIYANSGDTTFNLVTSGSPKVSDLPYITVPSGVTAFVTLTMDMEMQLSYYAQHKINFWVSGTLVKGKRFTPSSGGPGPSIISHEFTLTAGTYYFETQLIVSAAAYYLTSYFYSFTFNVTAVFK